MKIEQIDVRTLCKCLPNPPNPLTISIQSSEKTLYEKKSLFSTSLLFFQSLQSHPVTSPTI